MKILLTILTLLFTLSAYANGFGIYNRQNSALTIRRLQIQNYRRAKLGIRRYNNPMRNILFPNRYEKYPNISKSRYRHYQNRNYGNIYGQPYNGGYYRMY